MEYNTIFDDIFRDEENVKERFGEIMGGKVLELESDKLIGRGWNANVRTQNVSVRTQKKHFKE